MNSVSVLVLAVIAIVIVLAPMVRAADVVEGRIRNVDPSGRMVTFDDGTRLTIPPMLTIDKNLLQPGVNVKANYEEKGGQKVATSLIVMPSR